MRLPYKDQHAAHSLFWTREERGAGRACCSLPGRESPCPPGQPVSHAGASKCAAGHGAHLHARQRRQQRAAPGLVLPPRGAAALRQRLHSSSKGGTPSAQSAPTAAQLICSASSCPKRAATTAEIPASAATRSPPGAGRPAPPPPSGPACPSAGQQRAQRGGVRCSAPTLPSCEQKTPNYLPCTQRRHVEASHCGPLACAGPGPNCQSLLSRARLPKFAAAPSTCAQLQRAAPAPAPAPPSPPPAAHRQQRRVSPPPPPRRRGARTRRPRRGAPRAARPARRAPRAPPPARRARAAPPSPRLVPGECGGSEFGCGVCSVGPERSSRAGKRGRAAGAPSSGPLSRPSLSACSAASRRAIPQIQAPPAPPCNYL